jgi:hypothetical protein
MQFGLAECRNGANHLPLYIFGERGVAPLQVHFVAVPALWFLGRVGGVLCRQSVRFCLQSMGNSVEADTFDDATKHRRTMQVGTNQVMKFGCGIDLIAG